jgi:hypothetical protein
MLAAAMTVAATQAAAGELRLVRDPGDRGDRIAEDQRAAAARGGLGPIHRKAHRVRGEIEAPPVAHRRALDDRGIAAAIGDREQAIALEASREAAGDDLEGRRHVVDRGRHLVALPGFSARRQVGAEPQQELGLETRVLACHQRDLRAVGKAVRRQQRREERRVERQHVDRRLCRRADLPTDLLEPRAGARLGLDAVGSGHARRPLRRLDRDHAALGAGVAKGFGKAGHRCLPRWVAVRLGCGRGTHV